MKAVSAGDDVASRGHPLDPLSKVELESLVGGLRRDGVIDHRHLIAMIQVEEPSKSELAEFRQGKDVDRAARVTVLDRSTGKVSEIVVTIGLDDSCRVVSNKIIEGAKAPVLSVESEMAIAAAKSDPRVIEALRSRGITDLDSVKMETWPIGAQIPKFLDDGRRIIWTPMWHKPTPEANFYAHPISGLHALIDIDSGAVLAVENDQQIAVPQTPGPYRQSQTGANIELKPLEIKQPEGVSFSVEGFKISWERWNLRVGFCQREGLVIHDVWFDDEGKPRKIAHRLSIAELVIPYGDPSQGAYRKNAFDTGEFGLGNYTNSLTLGCDCLGEIVYLDVAVAKPDGSVREIKNAICMHEEDFGILWKHVDVDGNVEVRRGRRFVVSSIVTINNYEYGYFWYFYQDGSIEFEAKLTGIVLTLADTPGKPHPSATELEPGLWAPYHQHILCARLDLDIDGGGDEIAGIHNTVIEVDSFAHELGPKNIYGGAYETSETVLGRELEAKRVVDPFKSRFWKIINPNRKNHMGKPVGYKLVPGHTTFPLALPESTIGKRAGFMYQHLWVTKNETAERYPAGDYPYQHAGGAGLPEWTQANREIENTDVVLWHVFGTNHIPRTEDWPVMPVERTGFHLKPSGFFSRSPAIDVAPAVKPCH
ncbi:copper methylamine oxidase [Acidimicrobiaceae bacterium]|nr:copper methylamine oxidase [Acidimicrobiaceae bacterium]